jgi:hypothetical protein
MAGKDSVKSKMLSCNGTVTPRHYSDHGRWTLHSFMMVARYSDNLSPTRANTVPLGGRSRQWGRENVASRGTSAEDSFDLTPTRQLTHGRDCHDLRRHGAL